MPAEVASTMRQTPSSEDESPSARVFFSLHVDELAAQRRVRPASPVILNRKPDGPRPRTDVAPVGAPAVTPSTWNGCQAGSTRPAQRGAILDCTVKERFPAENVRCSGVRVVDPPASSRVLFWAFVASTVGTFRGSALLVRLFGILERAFSTRGQWHVVGVEIVLGVLWLVLLRRHGWSLSCITMPLSSRDLLRGVGLLVPGSVAYWLATSAWVIDLHAVPLPTTTNASAVRKSMFVTSVPRRSAPRRFAS
jgi:hypothetical protein